MRNNFLSAFSSEDLGYCCSMHISFVTALIFIGQVLETDSDNSATQHRI
jgi:hypothetical protein